MEEGGAEEVADEGAEGADVADEVVEGAEEGLKQSVGPHHP